MSQGTERKGKTGCFSFLYYTVGFMVGQAAVLAITANSFSPAQGLQFVLQLSISVGIGAMAGLVTAWYFLLKARSLITTIVVEAVLFSTWIAGVWQLANVPLDRVLENWYAYLLGFAALPTAAILATTLDRLLVGKRWSWLEPKRVITEEEHPDNRLNGYLTVIALLLLFASMSSFCYAFFTLEGPANWLGSALMALVVLVVIVRERVAPYKVTRASQQREGEDNSTHPDTSTQG